MGSEGARKDHLIAKVAGRQHGVVTRGQLVAAGITKRAIARRVQSGRLHLVHRGVYAVGYPRLTFEGRCLAALLACSSDPAAGNGPDAGVSHLSAAAVWGMLRPEQGPIHVSAISGNGRKRRSGIVIHRPPSLCSAELTRRSGVWATKPERTLRDLRRTAPQALFQRALRKALDLRLVTEDVETRDRTDLTRSELERMFLRLCRQHRLPQPEVNARVIVSDGSDEGRASGGNTSYEVDFLWRDLSLIVETDGFTHHGHREAFEADRARDAHLQAQGYRVLRFTYRQVRESPKSVAASLQSMIDRGP